MRLLTVALGFTPTLTLPRDAGEERGGGLNGLNHWNDLNKYHVRLVSAIGPPTPSSDNCSR